ncbi:orotate phosphoribosyltransferase [Verrucomicrobium spinosum]|uniref:orotate phosphoribosyltransferase n=1 Tax=Verrucomicrobium spinosum TaxID=2736 RepID=UPI000AF195B1|nr:orotate phosphoribosyltransferase [Verrucomicrobium spinosum]
MSNATAQEALLEILLKKSVMFGDFTLASGAKSDLYVDCRLTTLDAKGAFLVGQVMFPIVRQAEQELGIKADGVGGLTMGADPVALAISIASHLAEPESPLNAYSVRKEAKKHGRQKLVEGNFKAGDSVVVVDDVITTGGSTIKPSKPSKPRAARWPSSSSCSTAKKAARPTSRPRATKSIPP